MKDFWQYERNQKVNGAKWTMLWSWIKFSFFDSDFRKPWGGQYVYVFFTTKTTHIHDHCVVNLYLFRIRREKRGNTSSQLITKSQKIDKASIKIQLVLRKHHSTPTSAHQLWVKVVVQPKRLDFCCFFWRPLATISLPPSHLFLLTRTIAMVILSNDTKLAPTDLPHIGDVFRYNYKTGIYDRSVKGIILEQIKRQNLVKWENKKEPELLESRNLWTDLTAEQIDEFLAKRSVPASSLPHCHNSTMPSRWTGWVYWWTARKEILLLSNPMMESPKMIHNTRRNPQYRHPQMVIDRNSCWTKVLVLMHPPPLPRLLPHPCPPPLSSPPPLPLPLHQQQ